MSRHKSATPVFCRCCAKPIKKVATTVYLEDEPSPHHRSAIWCRYAYPKPRPKTMAECAPLSDQKVISVKRNIKGQIGSFNEWDGESYYDPFFCSISCAERVGRDAAAGGWATDQWRKKVSSRDNAHLETTPESA